MTGFYYHLWFKMQAMDYWPLIKNTRLLWKLQDPVDSNKLSGHRQMITNELIDDYNQVALQVPMNFDISCISCVWSFWWMMSFSIIKVLQRSRFRIWKSARMVTDGMITADDGLHLGPVTLKHHVQVREREKKQVFLNNANALHRW